LEPEQEVGATRGGRALTGGMGYKRRQGYRRRQVLLEEAGAETDITIFFFGPNC
jgi:hypothetical protein